MKITKFEDINAWKQARKLTQSIYLLASNDPFCKDWGLRDQITRASGSIMNNIAEGYDSGSDTEFVRFLRYAQRSCSEVQSELYIALDQDYIDRQKFMELYDLANQIKAKIGGFIRYLVNNE